MNDLLLKLLSSTWPVSATFDACPIRGVLWCFSLERGEVDPEDLAYALKLLDEVEVRTPC